MQHLLNLCWINFEVARLHMIVFFIFMIQVKWVKLPHIYGHILSHIEMYDDDDHGDKTYNINLTINKRN